jgi:hypothetical protein
LPVLEHEKQQHPFTIQGLLQIRSQVCEYLSNYPNSTPVDVSRHTGIHPALIGFALHELEVKEVVCFVNSAKGRSKERGSLKYFIKSEGRFTA